MSLHNEWVSQYHKILKTLFLNLCSSQDVQSHPGNEWGYGGWAVPPVMHVSGETQRPVVVGCGPGCGRCTFSSQLRCWPVFQVHKSQDFLLCILKLQGTLLLNIWVVLVCWSFLPSFMCWPYLCACLQEDPYPCLVKQSPKQTLGRKVCCNHISWDQLYQLHPGYDTLSCSHKNEVSHLAHLADTDMKASACFFILEEILYLFCPDRFAAPCKGWCSWMSPNPLCLSKHCGQLCSCSFPQAPLQGMQAPFYLSVFCSLLLDPSRCPCGSERFWNTGGSPVAVSSSSFSLYHWPDFLT